jgi:hypothetical protein
VSDSMAAPAKHRGIHLAADVTEPAALPDGDAERGSAHEAGGTSTETLRRDRVRLELEPDHIGVWPDQRSKGQAGSGPQVKP